MQPDTLDPVERPMLLQHVLASLDRYWPRNQEFLQALPVAKQAFPTVDGPLRLVAVDLPEWASESAVDGVLLVPEECCPDPVNIQWEHVDWWLAAFLLLECWHERTWEQRHGPVHSYSYRLRGWDLRAWERAWVNRIGLFLRSWVAVESGQSAEKLFGTLPSPRVLMTHDVDAVRKTWAIRLKQGGFSAVNAVRLLLRGQPGEAFRRAMHGVRFVASSDNWWTIPAMQHLEREAGIRSRFNFYADDRRRTPQRWLLDPGYDVKDQRISRLLTELSEGGWLVGLHQSFDAWRSSQLMLKQRHYLQLVSLSAVTTCRQHWLRFSWADTWRAQVDAGFEQDTTLMFNDRPGFRSSAVLSWRPWDAGTRRVLNIRALPTVFMDSHFYDYQPMSAAERNAAFRYWLDEIKAVSGEVAVLWHPHTITSDYGWGDGFRNLLCLLSEFETCEVL